MAKFEFVTNKSSMAFYNGPSGTTYVINLGLPFLVKNKKDIAFFEKNYRFKKVGVVQSLFKKPEAKPDVDEVLKKELLEVEGLSEESANLLVETYHSKERLMEAVEQGFDLHESVPKSEQELLKAHLLKDLADLEKPEEEESKKKKSKKSRKKNKKGDT